MTHLQLVFVIVSGGLFFSVGLFFAIRKLARDAMERARAAIEEEGVVLEAGPQWITVRFRNFRSPGRTRGGALEKTWTTLVLTRAGRIVLLPISTRYWLEPTRVTVGVTDGALHIKSDQPSGEGVSGSVDYRVTMADPQEWVNALTKVGARAATEIIMET